MSGTIQLQRPQLLALFAVIVFMLPGCDSDWLFGSNMREYVIENSGQRLRVPEEYLYWPTVYRDEKVSGIILTAAYPSFEPYHEEEFVPGFQNEITIHVAVEPPTVKGFKSLYWPYVENTQGKRTKEGAIYDLSKGIPYYYQGERMLADSDANELLEVSYTEGSVLLICARISEALSPSCKGVVDNEPGVDIVVTFGRPLATEAASILRGAQTLIEGFIVGRNK